MRGVNFTAYQKRRALKYWLEEKMPIQKVCQKCKCTERSLWRWKKLYDGTLASLEPNTSRKNMYHPNSHTQEEFEFISNVFKSKPDFSFNEIYGILRTKHAYNRTYCGFYRYVVKKNLRPRQEIEKYVPKQTIPPIKTLINCLKLNPNIIFSLYSFISFGILTSIDIFFLL